jgi:hypothetical protein
MTSEPSPTPLRKIVCAYDLGALPTWWVLVHGSMKTRLHRAGARVRVELIPLSSLPSDADLIVVAPNFLPVAQAAAPETECLPITEEDHGGQVVRLLNRLRAEGRIEAVDLTSVGEAEPKITRWVGYERTD